MSVPFSLPGAREKPVPGSGTLHSGLLDRSAPGWGVPVPLPLHFNSGHLGSGGSGEAALAQPQPGTCLLRHFAALKLIVIPWNPSFTLS